jgi:hypothetical protein
MKTPLKEMAFFITRMFSGEVLMFVGTIWGILLWGFSILTAYALWGWPAVIVGLLLGGVGVIPVAMVACIFNAAWVGAGVLFAGTVFYFALRWTALGIMAALD